MVGVDDTLMKAQHKKINRADVALLCVAALQHPEYRNRCDSGIEEFKYRIWDLGSRIQDLGGAQEYELH